MSGTVLDTNNTSVKLADNVPALMDSTCSGGR